MLHIINIIIEISQHIPLMVRKKITYTYDDSFGLLLTKNYKKGMTVRP